MTANLTLQTLVDRKARTAKTGFAIAGVPCFANTFVQGGNSILRMMFSSKNRHLLVAANP